MTKRDFWDDAQRNFELKNVSRNQDVYSNITTYTNVSEKHY